ncbi:MAG: hypothetical protein AAGG50_14690 [Bacteroidota bacterium]
MAPTKDSFLVGEGVVVDLHVEVLADTTLDRLVLNRRRTQVTLTTLACSDPHRVGETRTLTGDDYLKLHQINRFKQVGRSFEAPAGSRWTSQLELFLYHRPLMAGRYALALSYQHGDTHADTTQAAPVEFVVTPAQVRHLACRWFGGRHPRDELEALWTTEANGGARWVYQAASKYDPGAIRVATDLGSDGLDAAGPPRLALLNDIAAMHADRYAVWLRGGDLGWLHLHLRGRLSEPFFVAHGLAAVPAPVLLDPPLQKRDGGLTALVYGRDHAGREALSLIEADTIRGGTARLIPLTSPIGRHPSIVWDVEEVAPSGALVYARAAQQGQTDLVHRSLGSQVETVVATLPGHVERLLVEQWTGRVYVGALTSDRGVWQAWTGTLVDGHLTLSGSRTSTAPGALRSCALLDGGTGMALLLETPEHLCTVTLTSDRAATSAPIDALLAPPTQLIATPRRGLCIATGAGAQRGLRYLYP